MLKKQLTLREVLQGCAACRDAGEIDRVIQSVQKAGLGSSPDKWVVADGPELLSMATARCGRLQETERLRDEIVDAAEKFDEATLRKALTKASGLGRVCEKEYPKQFQILLDLQDVDFVESKSAELRKQGSQGTSLVKCSNLEGQLQRLGVQDSTGMQDLARRLALRAQAIKDAADMDEKMAAQKVFRDLGNFSALRDPLAWGGPQAMGVELKQLKHNMLHFSPDFITQSLTELDAAEQKLAIQNFTNILRAMGDQHSSNADRSTEAILKTCNKSTELCNEVYMQMMRQLSGNPSFTSAGAGWDIFERLCTDVLPSDEMQDFVQMWLTSAAQAQTADDPNEAGKKGVQYKAESRRRSHVQLLETFQTVQRPAHAQSCLAAFQKLRGNA